MKTNVTLISSDEDLWDPFKSPVCSPLISPFIVLLVVLFIVQFYHLTGIHHYLQIHLAENNIMLQAIFSDDDTIASVLFGTGYQKPFHKISMDDKDDIINVISTYHTLVKVKAQIDQFVSGLQT